jgi:excisionase family DNA binding protein
MTAGAKTERVALTVPEAAETLGISVRHAWNLVNAGQLPSFRLGRRVVVPKQRLVELLDGNTAE